MRVGKYTLPRNTLVTGEGRIQGERLGIGIVQLEHDGVIIPVELTVYDNDGQDGIFIPGSMEASAVKEVAANLGQNLGTSISITNQSAKDQLLSELGKGAIQGVPVRFQEVSGGESASQIGLYPDALPERQPIIIH